MQNNQNILNNRNTAVRRRRPPPPPRFVRAGRNNRNRRRMLRRPLPLRIANARVRRIRRNMNRGPPMNTKGGPKLITPHNNITPEGLSFLKCAFSPPDFLETQVRGIPDNYRGKTLLKKHRLTSSITFTQGNDYYLLLLPTPGIAYWVASVPAGTAPTSSSVWIAVPYSDIFAMFGDGNTAADNVNQYRMVSNHFELISTTNMMSFSGSISAFKLNLKLINRIGTTDIWSITGLNGVNSTLIPTYSQSTKNGIYIGCYNDGNDFPFEPVLEYVMNARIPATIGSSDWGQLDSFSSGVFPAFYNSFESACIKITDLTSVNSFILKTWSCVEYIPTATSNLQDYTSLSPPSDPIALRAYKEIINSLPVAVPSAENANFWRKVLNILRTITGVGAKLPGPYGMISYGANNVLNGINDLV